MAKNPSGFNYRNNFLFLQNYVDLKIRKNKVNFTPAEKRKITTAIKSLEKEGVIYRDDNKNKYVPLVKFRKGKKKERVKGIKQELSGEFIRGAKTTDKLRGNTIVTGFYDKTFIPLDLSFAEEIEDNEQIGEFIYEQLFDVEIAEKIKKADYFTIVVANGWEVGRGNYKPRKSRAKTLEAKQAIMDKKESAIRKFSQNQQGRKNKLQTIALGVTDIVERIHNRNMQRYKLGMETISGVYLYQFKNQKGTGKHASKNKTQKRGKKSSKERSKR